MDDHQTDFHTRWFVVVCSTCMIAGKGLWDNPNPRVTTGDMYDHRVRRTSETTRGITFHA